MFSSPSNPNDHGVVPQALTNRLWTIKDTYLAGAGYPGLDGVYDFTFGGTSRSMLLDSLPTRAVEDYVGSSGFSTLAAQNDPRLNWNVLEIHDWPRFVKDHQSDPWKSKLGVSYLATAQGIPVIYYGMEQGLDGDCHVDNMNAGAANDSIKQLCALGYTDALYRQDMFASGGFRLGSTVASIDSLAYIGPSAASVWPDWRTDPYLDRTSDVYRTARKFNFIRRSCNPLRYGDTYFRWGESGSTGLMAFSRIDSGKEMVVVVNNAPTAMSIPTLTIDSGINQVSGQHYVNLTSGFQVATTERSGPTTRLSFGGMQIDGNSVMVFAHENNIAPWSSYLEASQCNDDPHWPPYAQ
jgi:glycosidase